MIRDYLIKYAPSSNCSVVTEATIKAHSAEDALTQLHVLVQDINKIISIEPLSLTEQNEARVQILHD